MGVGFYVAGSVCIACLAILFVMGNVIARVAVALFVAVLIGGFALFAAYATGLLAYLYERYLV